MTPTELLTQARKYRGYAAMLAPHLITVKADYIAKAQALEAQANPVIEIPAASITPRPLPAASSPTTLTLPKQIRIHSNLAVKVAGDRRPMIQRAFSIWATLRTNSQAHYDHTDVLKFYAAEFGQTERNTRRIIAAGEGIFWVMGRKNRMSILGKDRVFNAYGLILPGRVLLVDVEALTGNLKRLRASLFACFINKQSKWASRDTLQQITNVQPRTQLNYDAVNRQHKQSTFALGYTLETSKSQAKQLPNRYYPKFYPAFNGQKNDRRYNLYSSETNGAISSTDDTTGGRRLLFDNPNQAIETATRRGKMGIAGNLFAVLPGPPTKHGHLVLKPIAYAA